MVRERKLIFIIVLLLISIGVGFCSMNLSGKGNLSLSGVYDNDNWVTKSDANLTFNLDYNTAGVKSYFQYDLTLFEGTLFNDLSKAFIKFRLPLEENYITFNVGKTNINWGGGFAFNSGTPSFKQSLTILSAYIPLSLNFDTGHLIYFEGLVTLPLLDGEVFSGGGRMIFEFGKALIDSVEFGGIAEEVGEITLYGGLNGNLYFDYGLYTNFDPLNFGEIEVSLYLFKYYGKLNLRVEGFYQKENSSLYLSAGYLINDKLNLVLESLFYDSEDSYNVSLGLSYPIIQGLNAEFKLRVDSTNTYTVLFNLQHSFSQ